MLKLCECRDRPIEECGCIEAVPAAPSEPVAFVGSNALEFLSASPNRAIQTTLRKRPDDDDVPLYTHPPSVSAADVRTADLEAALAELVALKDLKDWITNADLSIYGVADAERIQAMDADYHRRKPLAWAAARAALSQQKGN